MNSRKRHYKRGLVIFTIGLLACTVATLGYMTRNENARAESYKRYVGNTYQGAFNELVTSVNEISSALDKSIYCTSPSITGAICTQIFGKAMAAQMSLGVLPFSTVELEQTASFISRVGDYAFSIARSAPNSPGYSEEERSNLQNLAQTARALSEKLRALQTQMNDGALSMDDLYTAERELDEYEDSENAEGEDGPTTAGGEFRIIESEFPEIPTLIYDGPFSGHISGMEPRLLEGMEEMSENAARRAAAEFLGVQEGRVFVSGKLDGQLPAYRFTAELGEGDVNLDITRRGGKAVSMTSERTPGKAALSADEAKEKARAFLSERGFENMTESYHMISGGVCAINYAYTQDGVICYSDLVKVGVALDDGSIASFEARGYVTAHYARELPAVEVDAETAKGHLTSDLTLLSEGLALIPTDGKYELLCHEFICETESGEHIITYVNAVTGDQEKILILIEDENGTLTI